MPDITAKMPWRRVDAPEDDTDSTRIAGIFRNPKLFAKPAATFARCSKDSKPCPRIDGIDITFAKSRAVCRIIRTSASLKKSAPDSPSRLPYFEHPAEISEQ